MPWASHEDALRYGRNRRMHAERGETERSPRTRERFEKLGELRDKLMAAVEARDDRRVWFILGRDQYRGHFRVGDLREPAHVWVVRHMLARGWIREAGGIVGAKHYEVAE